MYDETDAGHGRVERRVVETVDVEWLASRALWTGLQNLVRVQSERHMGEQISHETRYFLSSLPACEIERIAHAVRAHWQVENGLHWCLDIAFSEDQQRTREGNAASNMALLNKIALNLLKHTKSKVGVKSRRKRAGWDNVFLLQALGKASSI
ncbi:ISAs1 family transposase [Salmonella enterica subsp. enterica]|nr:ISAs1 family transposase [Salmonella enterica subsp. enterica]